MIQQSNTVEYNSLYEFRGHGIRATEGRLAKRVYEEALDRKVEVRNQEISNPKYTGNVLTYPKWFLEEYFHKSDPKDNTISADDEDMFDKLPF